MTNSILVNGDSVVFTPMFGAAMVTIQPGRLKGSGQFTIGGKKVCVDGDEEKVSVPGCPYVTPQYSIPGSGTITIKKLGSNQTAKKPFTGGKPVLLKGSVCDAQFMVLVPAQQPGAPPVPDPTPKYTGKGQFIPTNTTTEGI